MRFFLGSTFSEMFDCFLIIFQRKKNLSEPLQSLYIIFELRESIVTLWLTHKQFLN